MVFGQLFKWMFQKFKMRNKRGQGLSTNAIILIVLGIFVLVILLAGFYLGWGKLAPWLNKPNLGEVKNSCSIACSINDQFDFCSVNKSIKDGSNDKFEDTCFNLWNDTKYAGRNYGIQDCPSVTCS